MSGSFDYQTNFHDFSIHQYNERPPKVEKFEYNLPSINDVFNESTTQTTNGSSNDFQSEVLQTTTDGYNWESQEIYKNYPLLHTNGYVPQYIFDPVNPITNGKTETSNEPSIWYPFQPQFDPNLNEPQQQTMQTQIYDQGPSSIFQFQSNLNPVYLVEQDSTQTSIADYQPIYTRSPSICNDQQSTMIVNQQTNSDISDFGEFFMNSSAFFNNPASTSTSDNSLMKSRNKSAPPINNEKSNLRTNRYGKIVKKATQNCHANSRCSNCNTTDTTLWRRNSSGEVECNACNLYFRKNQTRRPVKLQKRGIMRRARNPRLPYSNEQSPDPLYVKISP